MKMSVLNPIFGAILVTFGSVNAWARSTTCSSDQGFYYQKWTKDSGIPPRRLDIAGTDTLMIAVINFYEKQTYYVGQRRAAPAYSIAFINETMRVIEETGNQAQGTKVYFTTITVARTNGQEMIPGLSFFRYFANKNGYWRLSRPPGSFSFRF